jgi:hypothetical protein
VEDPEKDKLSMFPRRSLSGSISLALLLLDKVSRAGVDVRTAATALGYPTINGATKTTLAALRIYGLIDKPHGKDLVVPSACSCTVCRPCCCPPRQPTLKR